MEKLNLLRWLRDSRVSRIICAFSVLSLLGEILSPTLAMALTSGPSQPEFSSFEPVATTDMVNDFTGDFTYNLPVLNVPGPEGGGYSMSLSYHSGGSSEEEASWVGFGWVLNPGAINRSKRGYADELNGATIKKYNKNKPNWTQSAKFDCKIEKSSQDQKEPKKDGDGASSSMDKLISKVLTQIFMPDEGDEPEVSISLAHTINYNNYSGFSISNGFGGSAKGIGSLNMNRTGGESTYGVSINPQLIMRGLDPKRAIRSKIDQLKSWCTGKNQQKSGKLSVRSGEESKGSVGQRLGLKSTLKKNLYQNFINTEIPALGYSVARTQGASWNYTGNVQFNVVSTYGLQLGFAGNFQVSATEGEEENEVYGYMHSDQANQGGAADELYDYQLEKESTFNKHDKNLGIPFNNADQFSASGNGVVGGFKLLHEQIGFFYPNQVQSDTKIRQLGFEVGLGQTIQVGVNLGVGKQVSEVKGHWAKMPDMSNKIFYNSGKPRMRFNGDLAGEVNYGNDYDELIYPTIEKGNKLELGNKYNLYLNTTASQNSSFIDYTQAAGGNGPNPYIDTIKITNKDGGKSNYGIAVLNRNEAELTIGIDEYQDGKFLVEKELHYDNPLDNKTVNGTKMASPYPSTYLLTSNTTFNYIDADGSGGPSDSDLGGWTKFGYNRAYGGTDWYRYRTPYNGLTYNRGRLLDLNDGTGSMSSGEKQVYYLKNVETKSHIAFFVTNKMTASTFTVNFPIADYPFLYSGGSAISSVTNQIVGSGTTRFDGIDAAPISSNYDAAAASLNAKGTHDLEKLEKIVLFAKDDMSNPLTVTNFEYDYSLCQGIPNSTTSANSPSKDRGKLTLKRVWTESGGEMKSLIAPYEFEYEYFHSYPQTIINKYQWTKDEFNDKYTSNDAKQNPYYTPGAQDCWGNYQVEGEKRQSKMITWVDQTPDYNEFDPAAWQLKRIKLPSGGEIHINYEQKDYLYVQDERPTAMVSLLEDAGNKDEFESDESVFCINESDLDVGASISTYTSVLNEYFLKQNHKLYFKILYAFTEDGLPELNTENRRFEYITGYTVVNKITVTGGNKILLHLGDVRQKCNGDDDAKKDKTLPRAVCYSNLLTNGGQNLGLDASNYKNDDFTSVAYNQNPINAFNIANQSAGKALVNTVKMFKDWITMSVKNVRKKKACKKINFSDSYFKLPVFKAKKGGGVRVKRLLSYDPGINGESGGEMLFGTEYLYKNIDGTSSGVATNEPAGIREENCLVTLLERKKQRWIEKIRKGRDTKNMEGPLGENLLPSAQVVHSRIVTQNIHSGKTGGGHNVSIYHTCKDYPMQVEFSNINKKDNTLRKRNLTLPLGKISFVRSRAWATQGYLFIMNDMHGKIANKSSYAGVYNSSDFNESSYTTRTNYQYSAQGERISSLLYNSSNGTIEKALLMPGTEEDYTMYSSNVSEKTFDIAIETDFNLTLPVLPGLGVKLKGINFQDAQFSQCLTSKVVKHVSYLLSTTNINDGVIQVTENLAFDKYTGDPVLTRTFDGYVGAQETIKTQGGSGDQKGYYYSLNIPAAWMYSSMRSKSLASTNTNQLSLMAGNVVTYSTNALYSAINNTNSTSVWSPVNSPLANVVNAQATGLKKNWFNTGNFVEFCAGTFSTAAMNTANSFYYPEKTFTYRDDVKDANATGGKIYKDGVCTNSFKFFNWSAYQNTANYQAPAEWYSESMVSRYAPSGNPLEEIDALKIKSSMKLGYNNLLPVTVMQNGAYEDSRFTDFEYGQFINSAALTTEIAHTGRKSYKLHADPSYVIAQSYPLHTHRGLSLKIWLRSKLSSNYNDVSCGLKNTNPSLKAEIGGKKFDFKPVASTGEWTLYSCDIHDFKGLLSGSYNIGLSYNYVMPNETVHIDDLRIQPLDASMNCSVYYPDHKLAAQFDDQHFAVCFEYNGKGQLVRKMIETERGFKTLQEQQYNTPLKSINQ